jgi:hypothetical protein
VNGEEDSGGGDEQENRKGKGVNNTIKKDRMIDL